MWLVTDLSVLPSRAFLLAGNALPDRHRTGRAHLFYRKIQAKIQTKLQTESQTEPSTEP